MNISAKKLLASMLVAASILSAAGCGSGSDSSGSTASSTGSSTASDTKPAIREVTAVRPIPDDLKFPEGDSLENNIWTRQYESDLGIKLKYKWMTPVAQYEQKLNISIASGDIPDIFQVNSVQLKQLVEDDQLADLTGIYEKNASEYTKNVLNQDGNALLSATFDGKLLAIPKMGSGLGQTNVLWVRTDWLKKLNLQEPKTMDDVIKIAQAFTENDPDGNNKKDTYGFGINKDLWGMFASLEGFFNGYGAYPNTWIEDGSGNLVNGNIMPEMKTALASLKDMFNKGYIDPEFGVKDSFKVSANVGEGKIGMLYGLFWNMGWLSDAKKANPDMTWKPFGIVGTKEGGALAQVPFPVSTYYVVNKKAVNPEAIIEMLNLQLEKCFGETAEPGKYNVDQAGNPIFEYPLIYSEPPMKNVDAQVKVSKALESKDTSALNAEEKGYYDQIQAYRGGDLSGWPTEMMYGPEGSLAVINGYATNKKVYDNRYFGPPTSTMTQKDATLSQIQLQTFTDIIMNGDINQFEKYVTDWKSLGGDAITAEVNKWNSERK
ncbi:extracellular solute-binding protein [Ruminiclostridium cellobioparum]|uniref:ABC-type sugar transport system, periplasmic component n=1 Tax=Ruminiclostridium cellobioparum subsp. termitidis CT1112 TaxID=1195236 RepID=S0FUJ1_RUMCE|nr:extracellular solute-binding protein [Ruminiclostridium cellobioparum]EMS73991.1 ABC-type sugar transport system, periplasmic component [Ruminiclostridium cellobioparum subsp. termitidis CT1112]